MPHVSVLEWFAYNLFSLGVGVLMHWIWTRRPHRKSTLFIAGETVAVHEVPHTNEKRIEDALYKMASDKIDELIRERNSMRQELADLREALRCEQLESARLAHER